MSTERFSVFSVFHAIDRVTAPVRRMENKVSQFASVTEKSFNRADRSITRFNRNVRGGATTAAIGVTALSAAMGKLIMVGAEYDHAMASSAARFFIPDITKGLRLSIARTTEEYQAMDAAAREVGRTTQFTSSEAGESLKFLAMAGFEVADSIEMLPRVAGFATANMTDMARATDMATDAIGAFGLRVDHITDPVERAAALNANLKRIMDGMTFTANKANMTISQLFETIKQGGPSGTAMGQDLETVMAMSAVVANAGIKGQKAAVALKNIMMAVAAPVPEALRMMQMLGLKNFDPETGAITDVVAFFEELAEAQSKLTETQQARVYETLFGKIPLPSAVNMTESISQVRQFREEMVKMLKEGNITEDMAAFMRQSTLNQIKTFWSAVEGVIITTFFKIQNSAGEGIVALTEWVRKMEDGFSTQLAGKINYFITNFSKISEQTISVLKWVAAWVAFSMVVKTLASLTTVISFFMANPVLAVWIGVLTVLLGLLTNIEGRVRSMGESTSGLADTLMAPFRPLLNMLNSIWEKIQLITGFRDVEDPIDGTTRAAERAYSTREERDEEISFIEMLVRTDQGTTAEVTQSPKGMGVKTMPTGAFQ